MRRSLFRALTGLLFAACATPGHPGAQPLRMTADNNFGPRDQVDGNPLADRLAQELEKKGPRAMLSLASGKVFLAGFPASPGPSVRIGMLAVKGADGKLVPIVVPTQGTDSISSSGPKDNSHARPHKTPDLANGICQYLGYEKASRVMVRPIQKTYCDGGFVDHRKCKWESASEYEHDPKQISGWSTVYRGRSAIRGQKLRFLEMTGRVAEFPEFSDPLKVVKAGGSCEAMENSRLKCEAFDPTQISEVYGPQAKDFGIINRLTCSNANKKAGDLVRKALKMVAQEKVTPRFTAAMKAYQATESRQYLLKLKALNAAHSDHHLGDELRRMIMPSSTRTMMEAALYYYEPGVREQLAREPAFKKAFYQKLGFHQVWVLGMILADASNQEIAAALGSKSAKTRDFYRVERGLIEATRLDLESSVYAQLATVYLESAKALVAGQPIGAGVLGAPPSKKKAKRRQKKAAKPDTLGSIRKLEAQIIKWFSADQIGPKGATDGDRAKVMEAYQLLRAYRIGKRIEAATPTDFDRAWKLYVNISIGRDKDPAVRRLPMARGLSAAARARAHARETKRIMREYDRKRKREQERWGHLNRSCSKMPRKVETRSSSGAKAQQADLKKQSAILKEHCLKRAKRVAKPEKIKLPIPDKLWLSDQRSKMSTSCQREIDARLTRDLEKLIAAGMLLQKCWPTIEDNMALERRIMKIAKPLRKKVDKRIQALVKQKEFFSATTAAEDLERLFGGKWVRGWKKKVDKAEAAWERKQARLSRKAKQKGIKACMKALSGPFLCSNASKLFCGQRCGHTNYCPCCTYDAPARRSACGG